LNDKVSRTANSLAGDKRLAADSSVEGKPAAGRLECSSGAVSGKMAAGMPVACRMECSSATVSGKTECNSATVSGKMECNSATVWGKMAAGRMECSSATVSGNSVEDTQADNLESDRMADRRVGKLVPCKLVPGSRSSEQDKSGRPHLQRISPR